jgi:acyl carrier protein
VKQHSQQDIEAWVSSQFIELGIQGDDAQTDFFEAGGSSLLAIKLIAMVDEKYGSYTLPPVDLFERPTLTQIAQTIHANIANERATA